MKNKFNRKNSKKDIKETLETSPTIINTETTAKEMRSWGGYSDKVTNKQMENIDLSTNKGGEIDIDRQKEIYLGGDDEELEGFYNSDDEVDFENFKRGKTG